MNESRGSCPAKPTSQPIGEARRTGLVPVVFTGKAGEYFRIWFVNVALTILTVGIYSAWAKVRTLRYLHGHTRVDGASFDYLAEPAQILRGRLAALGILVVYGIAGQLSPVIGGVLAIGFVLLTPWLIAHSLAFRAYHTSFRNVRFGFDGDYGEAARAYLLNPILAIFTLGLAYPWVHCCQKQFVVNHARFGTTPFRLEVTSGSFFRIYWTAGGIFLGGALLAALAGPFGVLLVVLAAFFAYYYVTTAVTNLTYNRAWLGEHGFVSTLQTGTILWIVLTNTLAIVLSLGLLLPWARIRMARYHASCLHVRAAGGLDDFVTAQEERVSALGQEIGEMLDFDVGF